MDIDKEDIVALMDEVHGLRNEIRMLRDEVMDIHYHEENHFLEYNQENINLKGEIRNIRKATSEKLENVSETLITSINLVNAAFKDKGIDLNISVNGLKLKFSDIERQFQLREKSNIK